MSLKLIVVRILYWLKGLFEDPTELFNELKIDSDDEILEIGCAIGYHTLPLARIVTNGKVYAADIWEEGLNHLKNKTKSMENIKIIHQGAERIELPSASIDRVICFDTLHEMPKYEQVVLKWLDFLKTGGSLFFKDPDISSEKIQEISNGNLEKTGEIRKIHTFVRK